MLRTNICHELCNFSLILNPFSSPVSQCYPITQPPMTLLERALQEENYELAALAIVYGMLNVIHDRKEAQKPPKGQPERPDARVLQPGS